MISHVTHCCTFTSFLCAGGFLFQNKDLLAKFQRSAQCEIMGSTPLASCSQPSLRRCPNYSRSLQPRASHKKISWSPWTQFCTGGTSANAQHGPGCGDMLVRSPMSDVGKAEDGKSVLLRTAVNPVAPRCTAGSCSTPLEENPRNVWKP
jgi:hypothetical protein